MTLLVWLPASKQEVTSEWIYYLDFFDIEVAISGCGCRVKIFFTNEFISATYWIDCYIGCECARNQFPELLKNALVTP